MKTLCMVYTGFLILLLLANPFSDISSLDLTQIDENQICKQNFATENDCHGEASHNRALVACEMIENDISTNSQVFYALDLKYYEGINHYSTNTIALSACSVEPSTTADVAIIMKIIRELRVPFAIKGGGHSFNHGFSSTIGVHIAMRRFSKITFHPKNQTVDIGSGLAWDDVYEALEPYNVSVIGGRVAGVGVGGLALGGGYGWKSNEYGLTIDNVFEYELVTPNGTIVYVNNETYPDIFFGLKGGLNNFGIVTNFNMRALPQTQIYGGFLLYDEPQFDNILMAIINFQNTNTDPKAQIEAGFFATADMANFYITVFYDHPTAPENTFKEFTDIHHNGVLETRSYLSLIQATAAFVPTNMRGFLNTISVTNLTSRFLQKMKQQFIHYTGMLHPILGTFINFAIEPFLPTYFDKSQDGAYPHKASSNPLFPIRIQFSWQLPLNDDFFANEIKSAADTLLQTVLDDGQDVGGIKQIRYPNYALENTPLSEIYGNNVERLKSIRQAWDPENIMYLTGGFKF